MMKYVKKLLEKSALEWNISRKAALVLIVTPFIISVVLAFSRLSYGLYRFLLQEDGPIEWLTVLCFVLACIIGVRIALLCFQSKRGMIAVLYIGFALVMFFAAGEEISWGQRLFHIKTPEALEQVNKQDELNLHNIGDALKVLDMVELLIGGAGCVLYIVNEKIDLGKLIRINGHLFVIPFFLSSWFAVVFFYRMFRLFIWRQSGFTITKYAEWTELCLAFGLFFFSWLVMVRLRIENSEPVLAGTSAFSEAQPLI
jgi:hypothetical protein